MRNILGLLLIIVLGFTSCEGRITKNQALAKDIEEFNKTVSVQIDVYKPENYTERQVDTTLNNGFRVKIKTYTDMDNSVLFTKIKDTINYQTYYRNFKFDILVEKNNKVIYNKSFDKQKANKAFNFNSNLLKGSELYNFDKLAILNAIQLDDDPSYTNTVAIDVMYAIPETDKVSHHKILINDKGKANFIQTKKH
ncbi:MAG: hypothetical protein CMC05_04725 [Flavobacteriaceae bacterium]|nr:hypothetical protein [Flavobacteriaceae bacterium]MBD09954.1 hypothetical protein [Flavobacteriaceae bacterium]|tara:strand:- start:1672 stop:2256 length:585 start_codon:yes stop_codon:yes gene_type:complete